MTTARRLAFRFGAMALTTLCLQGAVSVWLSFRSLQEDAARDAVGLARLAAGLMRPSLEQHDMTAALRQLASVQDTQDSARFVWRWIDDVPMRAEDRAQLETGHPVTSMHRAERHVLAMVPVYVSGRLGMVQVDDDVSLQARHVIRVAITVLALIVLLVAAFFVVGDRLGRRLVGNPVKQLIGLTQRVSKGELDARVQLEGDDELARLGRALNAMVVALRDAKLALETETRARLDAADRLRHADRLVTVGRLSAGVAHELGTPLNVVLLRAQLIAELHDEETEKHATVIQSQVANMTRIVKQLLGFARKNASTPTQVDVRATAENVRELLLPTAEPRGVQIDVQGADVPLALVDRQSLEQVLSNLVMNAVQALAHGGVVTVRCRSTTTARTPQSSVLPWVAIDVTDSGPGLSSEVREHLFEPFVTTKPIGSGTGLGLSVAWGLVEEWGGWLEVSPPDEPGCRFTCYLPLTEAVPS